MTINLTEWDCRNILVSLSTQEQTWLHAINASSDEDYQADLGNDLALLRLTRDTLQAAAVKEFGEGVVGFSGITL